MKINNVAIAGIFVTIFGLIETANATTIASQAYVDAKDGLKQDKLTSASGGNVSVDNTSNTAASRAVTGITATNGVLTFTTQPISAGISASDVVDDGTGSNTALQLTSDDDKAPSIRAILAAKQAAQTGSTVTAWSTSSGDGSSDVKVPTVKAVTQQIDKKINDAVQSIGENVITSASDNLVNGGGFRSTVAYYNEETNAHTEDLGEVSEKDNVFLGNSAIAGKLDDYVPTVAAVEARALALQAYAASVASTAASGVAVTKTDTKSATWDSSNNTLTVASSGDGASTSKVATPKQVANTITDVKSYIDYKASGALARKDAVGSADITDGSIANVDISSTAAIDFSKMNDGLKDVNSSSADGNCTAGSPCVLTFYKVGSTKYYKWTNLDTESTNAVPNS